MDQPLGRTVGNALETAECIETLKGRGPRDLESLSIELTAWMLRLAGVVAGLDEARARAREALASGAGLEKLRQVIELQGGDPRVCDDSGRLAKAADTVELRSPRDGRVAGIACRAIGHAAMLLGAGRETVDSRIDAAVGIVLDKKLGDPVARGERYATLHVNDKRRLAEARRMVEDAFRIGPEAPPASPLVRLVLD